MGWYPTFNSQAIFILVIYVLPLMCIKVKVKVSRSCPTLCNPMEYVIHGTLQARILEWVVFPSSRGSSQPRDQTRVSCITGGFFPSWARREAQEYWSGQPFPPPGDLPDPGIEPGSRLQADPFPVEPEGKQRVLKTLVFCWEFCGFWKHLSKNKKKL